MSSTVIKYGLHASTAVREAVIEKGNKLFEQVPKLNMCLKLFVLFAIDRILSPAARLTSLVVYIIEQSDTR